MANPNTLILSSLLFLGMIFPVIAAEESARKEAKPEGDAAKDAAKPKAKEPEEKLVETKHKLASRPGNQLHSQGGHHPAARRRG